MADRSICNHFIRSYTMSGRSSGVEHLLPKQRAVGSNPIARFQFTILQQCPILSVNLMFIRVITLYTKLADIEVDKIPKGPTKRKEGNPFGYRHGWGRT